MCCRIAIDDGELCLIFDDRLQVKSILQGAFELGQVACPIEVLEQAVHPALKIVRRSGHDPGFVVRL